LRRSKALRPARNRGGGRFETWGTPKRILRAQWKGEMRVAVRLGGRGSAGRGGAMA
jgi:hypothetical protein